MDIGAALVRCQSAGNFQDKVALRQPLALFDFKEMHLRGTKALAIVRIGGQGAERLATRFANLAQQRLHAAPFVSRILPERAPAVGGERADVGADIVRHLRRGKPNRATMSNQSTDQTANEQQIECG